MVVVLVGDSARIRQIAVEEAYRGTGIGTELIRRAEEAIRGRGILQVMLHARVTARGFFEKLGYAAWSANFTEVTIPHIVMEKNLAQGA